MVIQSDISAAAVNVSCASLDDHFINKLSIQRSVNNKWTLSNVNTDAEMQAQDLGLGLETPRLHFLTSSRSLKDTKNGLGHEC